MPILVAGAAGPVVAASARRKAAGRSVGSRFTLESDAEAPGEAPAAAFVCPLALLQLQEAREPEAGGTRAKTLRHGAELLDRLDELRLALLSGALPPARLQAIADALAVRSGRAEDPRLGAVIAEIELRCAVELAKLRRATGGGPWQAPAPQPVLPSASKA